MDLKGQAVGVPRNDTLAAATDTVFVEESVQVFEEVLEFFATLVIVADVSIIV